jgi:predicted MPP superfamily phosphohydrolase
VRIFLLYLLACWSVIALVVAGAFPGSLLVVLALAVYSAAPIFVFLTRRGWAFYPGAAFRILVVRGLLYTQVLLPVTAAAGVLGELVGLPFGHAQLFARAFAAVMVASASALLVIGYVGSRSLVVRDVNVSIPNLPQEFEGTRIVQLSDLHVGPQIPTRFLERIVRTVESLSPDLIAVTGDLIDDRPEDVSVYARTLGALKAPLGVFMIAGNHDVYAGWSAVQRELHARIDGHVLVNESLVLKRGGAQLAIVGVGDPAGTQRSVGDGVAPDVTRAFAMVPLNTVVVALAHNPALWPAIVARGAALTLSGHTHWGQFAIPKRGWSLASRFLKYAMGAYREGGSMLYIAPGTGYWGIPFRIGALPEITSVTLRQGAAASIEMGGVRRAPAGQKKLDSDPMIVLTPHV